MPGWFGQDGNFEEINPGNTERSPKQIVRGYGNRNYVVFGIPGSKIVCVVQRVKKLKIQFRYLETRIHTINTSISSAECRSCH